MTVPEPVPPPVLHPAAEPVLEPAAEPVLEIADLHVTYAPGVRAVRGVGFAVRRGEVLGVVGESGSGKTALALATLGLLPESARVRGSVRLRGRELLGRSDAELSRVRGKDLAMVFQDPLSALTPVHQIGDQIAETIRVHAGATRGAARARAVELMELVGIPGAARVARGYPHELSGGMRQRVMIAMAIANDPLAIVADEPTTALDVTVQEQVLEVLRVAKEATGAAIVLITHDLGVVAGFADRVMVMYAGRAVESGPVGEVYRRPRMPYTIGLMRSLPRLDGGAARALPMEGAPATTGCPFAPRCPVVLPACARGEPPPAPVGPAGHVAACVNTAATERQDRVFPDPEPVLRSPRPPRHERPPVLEVTGLVKHHPRYRGTLYKRRVGAVRAVDGISLDVRAGETLGLVGESGCGKTSALMEILRLGTPQQGRITVFGQDTAALTAARRKALRRDLQVVFQDPFASLDPRMRVAAILTEPLTTHGVRKALIPGRVQELLKLVGLEPEHASRYPQDLSGGQRQRVGIARALALEPRLLLLDEPVAALDVSVQAGVTELLEELQARMGLAYLFVAHDLAVVRQIADRVAVMYHGRIVEIGSVDAVYEAPAHPYTRALLDAVPYPDPERERRRRRTPLAGDPPDPSAPPEGCRFRPRCPRHAGLDGEQRRLCAEIDPVLRAAPGGQDQRAACHYPQGETPWWKSP
ncbi:dipeptide ABC transporter ATP-binding protein [Actinomadura macrotermitis]|uniref:Putative ABC transporter ATP-binding protein n=1 Tax=Actinomadura macrotermitis TaxID=2585200 RepID=A0A7K0BNJ3_9ACTN|nr:ABC transporter ATP-binding protein [Actinomadura macrotermitis]MQY02769.1 putative ABC transporter ATP-binding protein [Actinomadura macrotermitis]